MQKYQLMTSHFKHMKIPKLTEEEKEIFEMLKENNLYDEILNLGYLYGREEMIKEVYKK